MNIHIKLTITIIKFLGLIATIALIFLDINPIATVAAIIWIIYAFTAQFSAWAKLS